MLISGKRRSPVHQRKTLSLSALQRMLLLTRQTNCCYVRAAWTACSIMLGGLVPRPELRDGSALASRRKTSGANHLRQTEQTCFRAFIVAQKTAKKHGRLIRHATATVANNDGTGRDLAKLVSRFTAFSQQTCSFLPSTFPFWPQPPAFFRNSIHNSPLISNHSVQNFGLLMCPA